MRFEIGTGSAVSLWRCFVRHNGARAGSGGAVRNASAGGLLRIPSPAGRRPSGFGTKRNCRPALLVRTLQIYSRELVLAGSKVLGYAAAARRHRRVFVYRHCAGTIASAVNSQAAAPTLLHRISICVRGTGIRFGFEPSVLQRVDPFNNSDKELGAGACGHVRKRQPAGTRRDISCPGVRVHIDRLSTISAV